MFSAYFDTNVASYFCDAQGKFNQHYPLLKALVDANDVRVYGSTNVLLEFAARAEVCPSAYLHATCAYMTLAERRFLLDRPSLMHRELSRRGQLSEEEACVGPPVVAAIRAATTDDLAAVRRFADETRAAGRQFKDRFDEGARKVEARTLQEDPDRFDADVLAKRPKRGDGETVKAQLQRESGQVWGIDRREIYDMMSASRVPLDYGFSAAPLEQLDLPVTYCWFAYTIARARWVAANNGAFMGSDRSDWEHYAYAAIPGVLVTDDTAFRNVVDRIAQPHVSYNRISLMAG